MAFLILTEALYFAIYQLDVHGLWVFGKTRHTHDFACYRNDETSTCIDNQIAYVDGESFGCAYLLLIVGEGVLGFGNADGKVAPTVGFELFELGSGRATEGN